MNRKENVMRTARIVDTTGATTAVDDRTAVDEELSTRRLNVMRFGYAFMGVGLAIVKWPLLIQDAPSLPVLEGVVTCLLTAMSLLAFLGLRYPIRMLPILLTRSAGRRAANAGCGWRPDQRASAGSGHILAGDWSACVRRCVECNRRR
jgi:hypothetical protein